MKTIFTIVSVLTFTLTFAQWTNDTDVNTLVVTSEASDIKALNTSAGETYVVYWKSVPAPTNFELRLQVLDADGNQTLGEEGMLVSDQIPMSTFTVLWNIVVDEDDNLYIGVTGTGGGDPAFAFKMNAEGNFVWDENGVSIGNGYVVTILPLSNGGAIISWLDSSGAMMQRFDNSGNSVWPTTQAITGGTGFTIPGNFFEISEGDYIAVFHSSLGGINSHLYAQRYNSDGVSQWSEPTQLSNNATVFNREYRGVQDGETVYMAYFGSTGTRFDAYLQRIDSDGSIPWGINGSDFDTNMTNNETNIEMAFQGGADEIWAVCTYSDSSQNNTGEFVQKFDKTTGARLFTDTAKEVFPIGSSKVHAGQLQLMNGMPLFIIKEGFDNGATPTSLNVVSLEDTGDFSWTEESRPIATFGANKSRVQFTKPISNQSVTVFVENKGGGPRIYAQNFTDGVLSVNDVKQDLELSYNNPVENSLTIKTNVGISKVTLYSILGQQILTKNFNSENNLDIQFDGHSAGIYILKLQTIDGETKNIKITKR